MAELDDVDLGEEASEEPLSALGVAFGDEQ
jgi:hypothetical protein